MTFIIRLGCIIGKTDPKLLIRLKWFMARFLRVFFPDHRADESPSGTYLKCPLFVS